jgi:hypothetical protein
MKKILFILFVGLFSGWVCAQEPVTVKNLGVSTFGSQVIGINNYAPAGSPGNNMWIGNGGQSSTGTASFNNIGIGIGVMTGNLTGRTNIGIGSFALFKNTSGVTNVAIGDRALSTNTTGSINMAVGGESLLGNTIGIANTALGYQSMYANTQGSYNTGIGFGALSSNTIGEHSLAIGVAALGSSTMSVNNVAIGNLALGAKITGNGNTAIGFSAGRFTVTNINNTTSWGGVYIGADSKTLASGSSNEIVIGSSAIGNGSNTTTIGNSNTTHTVFQYGKTLVGYSAVQDRGNYALQVNGQIYATNAAIATSDARLKERIAPLSSGLKEVMALRPCTFDFKQGTEQNLATGRQVGFIAQEVASVLQGREWASSVVQEAGGNLGIAETKLLPLLVKAVQEQQAQIEKLSVQLSLLQSQISQLERKAEATKSSAKRVAHSK